MGRDDFQGVTDAELTLLKLLWEPGTHTPVGLQEALAEEGTDWAYTTVQTLLHRLLKKGYVSREKVGVTQVYRAEVDRDALLQEHMSDLAERLCEGASTPLLLNLVKSRRFSKKDLAHFRSILDEAEAAGKKPRRRKDG